MENIKTFERAGAIRMAGEDRRQQILNVAIRLFSQRGFRGTTTREIAHAAEVSEAIIFRHFATKQDLYAAILDYKACAAKVTDIARAIAEAESRGDEAVFEAIAKEMLRIRREDLDFFRLLLYSALEGHDLSRMFSERYVFQSVDPLREFIRERQRTGALRGIDPPIIARAFMGMISHYSMVKLLFAPPETPFEITDDEVAQKFAEILMRGIGAKKSNAASAKNGHKRAKPTSRTTKKIKAATTRAKKIKS